MSPVEMSNYRGEFSISRQLDGKHIIEDDRGRMISYEEAPRQVRAAFDRIELRRQGQLELSFG